MVDYVIAYLKQGYLYIKKQTLLLKVNKITQLTNLYMKNVTVRLFNISDLLSAVYARILILILHLLISYCLFIIYF